MITSFIKILKNMNILKIIAVLFSIVLLNYSCINSEVHTVDEENSDQINQKNEVLAIGSKEIDLNQLDHFSIPLINNSFFINDDENNINIPPDYAFFNDTIYIVNRIDNKIVLMDLKGNFFGIDSINDYLSRLDFFPLNIAIIEKYIAIMGPHRLLVYNKNRKAIKIIKEKLYDFTVQNNYLFGVSPDQSKIQRFTLLNNDSSFVNYSQIQDFNEPLLNCSKGLCYFNPYSGIIKLGEKSSELESFSLYKNIYLEDATDNHLHFLGLSKDGNYEYLLKDLLTLKEKRYKLVNFEDKLNNQQIIVNDAGDRGKDFSLSMRVYNQRYFLALPVEDTLHIFVGKLNFDN